MEQCGAGQTKDGAHEEEEKDELVTNVNVLE